MADLRSIPARATVAPAPTLKCNHRPDWQKAAVKLGILLGSAIFPEAHGGCCSVINSLCTKTVANLIKLIGSE